MAKHLQEYLKVNQYAQAFKDLDSAVSYCNKTKKNSHANN